MPGGGSGSRFAWAGEEYEFIKASELPLLEFPAAGRIKVKGKEHSVVLQGPRVWKYQDGPALLPICRGKKLDVREALPSEYLDRLTLQNELFGDDLRVEGYLKNGKLVTSQTTIEGGEPTEKEIEATLGNLGWERIPTRFHNLPHNLMATAWMHLGQKVVMVDARPPNFKKTKSGEILAIDLMLVRAGAELLEFMDWVAGSDAK